MANDTSPVLLYWERLPPYEIVAAASLAKVKIEPRSDPKATKDTVVTLKVADGVIFQGAQMILKYLARAAAPDTPALYGSTALEACTIDQWLEFGDTQFSAGMWVKVRNAPAARNVRRWFDFCSAQPPLAAALEQLAPKKSSSNAKAAIADRGTAGGKRAGKTGEAASLDMELPGAVRGAVVTRFPPEPSGYLHIGHAKAALLNQIFADRYDGRLIVRFDDTNPSKESTEFVDNIIDDMARLGLRYGKLTYTSDFFPQMVEMARALIGAGHIYADNTDVDRMREERMRGTPSKCRSQAAADTLRIFNEEMMPGTDEGKTYCLRVRLDMAADNKCLRDPVAYRCNDHPHWRTGTTFKCYPTYDFACPFVDASQGVTHALRTSEYKDREEQFYRILAMMRSVDPVLPAVHIWDYSRLNFVHTVLSKRKLQKLVDTGVVKGWTDPRFPTVQGILRAGLQLPALKEFIIAQGASRNNNLQQWDKIWAINKQMIDPVAPRHTAVTTAGMVPVTLANGPSALELTSAPKHKKNPAVGTKVVYKTSRIFIDQADARALSQGEEVTLMDWGNCIMREVVTGADGQVTAIAGELHLDGDFKKTKLKLTWLADVPDVVPLRIVTLGYLITKAKLEEEDNFDDYVNRESWNEEEAIGDANMRALQQGEVLQLERKGYYRVDAAATPPGKPLVLFSIPDGRQKR